MAISSAFSIPLAKCKPSSQAQMVQSSTQSQKRLTSAYMTTNSAPDKQQQQHSIMTPPFSPTNMIATQRITSLAYNYLMQQAHVLAQKSHSAAQHTVAKFWMPSHYKITAHSFSGDKPLIHNQDYVNSSIKKWMQQGSSLAAW